MANKEKPKCARKSTILHLSFLLYFFSFILHLFRSLFVLSRVICSKKEKRYGKQRSTPLPLSGRCVWDAMLRSQTSWLQESAIASTKKDKICGLSGNTLKDPFWVNRLPAGTVGAMPYATSVTLHPLSILEPSQGKAVSQRFVSMMHCNWRNS